LECHVTRGSREASRAAMVARPRRAPPGAVVVRAGAERVIKATERTRRDRRIRSRPQQVLQTVFVLRATRKWARVRQCWARCEVLQRVYEKATRTQVSEKRLAFWTQREIHDKTRFRLRVRLGKERAYVGALCAWAFWPGPKQTWAAWRARGMEGDHLPFSNGRALCEARKANAEPVGPAPRRQWAFADRILHAEAGGWRWGVGGGLDPGVARTLTRSPEREGDKARRRVGRLTRPAGSSRSVEGSTPRWSESDATAAGLPPPPPPPRGSCAERRIT
jgi:hypothetical protein